MINYNIAGISSAVSAKELEQALKEHIHDLSVSYNPNPDTMVVQKAVSAVKLVDDSYAREEWGWQPAYTSVGELVTSFINEMKQYPERYN